MNIQKLMRQAQQMQQKMQEEIAALVVDATVGGGMVSVKMNGNKQVLAVAIDAEAVDPQDTAMLQDLVLAAVNEAGRKVDEAIQGKMSAFAGGIPGLPGMF